MMRRLIKYKFVQNVSAKMRRIDIREAKPSYHCS